MSYNQTHCRYCGNVNYGKIPDNRHPQHVHVHQPDGIHCIYCGGTFQGRAYDARHPDGVHDIQ
jgi:catalase